MRPCKRHCYCMKSRNKTEGFIVCLFVSKNAFVFVFRYYIYWIMCFSYEYIL